jgi:hypothetical protein
MCGPMMQVLDITGFKVCCVVLCCVVLLSPLATCLHQIGWVRVLICPRASLGGGHTGCHTHRLAHHRSWRNEGSVTGYSPTVPGTRRSSR